MNEREWVDSMARQIRKMRGFSGNKLEVRTGLRLAYGHEVVAYEAENEQPSTVTPRFETDLAIIEKSRDGRWRPRVVIEAKLGSVTTHDALTYSSKAASHLAVHPYLRYGFMLGRRGDSPLPGRLYRHGAQFDFLISFRALRPSEEEMSRFAALFRKEVVASRTLEGLLFDSRKKERDRYTLLHRQLKVS